METGLVFDYNGNFIHWHVPPDRSSGYLPDSRSLWEVLWENRTFLGGVAHTHPWNGEAHPSTTDTTTFAAIEAGLGKRLVWPIVTFSEVRYYVRSDQEYVLMDHRRFRIRRSLIEELRNLSR